MKGSNFQNKILNGLMIDLFSLPTLIIFTMGMKNFEHNCIFFYIYIYILWRGEGSHDTRTSIKEPRRVGFIQKTCRCKTWCSVLCYQSLLVRPRCCGSVSCSRALVLGQTGHPMLSGEGERQALVTESSGDLPSGLLQRLLKAVPDESQLMPVCRCWGCACVAPSLPGRRWWLLGTRVTIYIYIYI